MQSGPQVVRTAPSSLTSGGATTSACDGAGMGIYPRLYAQKASSLSANDFGERLTDAALPLELVEVVGDLEAELCALRNPVAGSWNHTANSSAAMVELRRAPVET